MSVSDFRESDEKLDRIVEGLQGVNVTLESLRVSLSSLVQICDDQESRLRTVERWQQKLIPLFAILTFMVGAVFTEFLRRFPF